MDKATSVQQLAALLSRRDFIWIQDHSRLNFMPGKELLLFCSDMDLKVLGRVLIFCSYF